MRICSSTLLCYAKWIVKAWTAQDFSIHKSSLAWVEEQNHKSLVLVCIRISKLIGASFLLF